MTTNLFLQLTENLGWVLLHSLWQGVILAGLLALALPRLKSANTRHLACLGMMILLGIVVGLTAFQVQKSPVTLALTFSEEQLTNTGAELTPITPMDPETAARFAAAEAELAAQKATERENARLAFQGSIWRWALVALGVFWLLGAIWCGICKWLGLRTLQKWKREAIRDLPRNVSEARARVLRGLPAGARRVPVWLSKNVASPVMFGLIKPVILLPTSLVSGLSVSDVELILAHEFAHWKRRDAWANALQLALETLFFYHPAIWWMSNKARLAREEATDDWVVARGSDRKAYARVLAAVSEWQASTVTPQLALSAAENSVAARIRRLATDPKPNSARNSALAPTALLLICLFWILTTGQPEAADASLEKLDSEIHLSIPAPRGQILDRNGRAWTVSKPQEHLAVDLRDLVRAYQTKFGELPIQTFKASALPRVGGLPDKDAERVIISRTRLNIAAIFDKIWLPVLTQQNLETDYSARQLAEHYHSSPGIVPWVFRRDLTAEQIRQLEPLRDRLPGFRMVSDELREYPLGAVASHVVGYVEMPDSLPDWAFGEERSRFDFILDPVHGRSGLEKTLDEPLRGKPGTVVFTKNPDGLAKDVGVLSGLSEDEEFAKRPGPLAEGEGEIRRKPVPGANVTLTLDSKIQMLAENALRHVGRGAAVVLDPRNGEVLAMASVPSFDPNHFVPAISPERWKSYTEDKSTPMFNRALSANAPGSVVLPAVALAGARTGTIEKKFICNGGVQYGNKFLKCWIHKKGGRHGPLGVVEGLKRSCNCYFYLSGNDMGIDNMVTIGRKLGLDSKTGIPLPSEQPGLMPTPDWLKKQGLQWSDAFTAMTAIGQGYFEATPLQLVAMTATIANGGKAYQPRLVKTIVDGEGKLRHSDAAVLRHDLVAEGIAPEHIELVRKGMWETVNGDGGTGARARIGALVAGRTGTAQTGNIKEPTNAWFTCFAPFEKPEYAVCVFVHNGDSGGRVAAPVARKILEPLLTGAEVEVTPLEPAKGHFERIPIVE